MRIGFPRGLSLFLACALLLAGCDSASTPTPSAPDQPTSAPPTAQAVPSETPSPASGVEAAWPYVVQPETAVVARVNGAEIVAQEYLEELRMHLRTLTSITSIDWSDAKNQALILSFQDEVLRQMVKAQLARYLAIARGVVVEDDELEAARASVQNTVLQSDQYESWADYLETMGATREQFDQQLATNMLYDKLAAQHVVPDEVEQVHAAHILVQSEGTAREVLDKLEAGEQFAALAEEYSTDSTAEDDGDLGWFPRGVMVSEFENAVFSMEIGEFGGPVQTQFGYHVIQLFDKGVRPLSDSARLQFQQQAFQAWFDDQMTQADIEIIARFQTAN